MLGKRGWNKGLTKETDPRVAKNAKTLSDTMQKRIADGTLVKVRRTEAEKLNLSIKAKARGWGGVTSKHRFYYQRIDGAVIYLHSSYETKFATILDKLGIDWIRPSYLRWIDASGIEHKYYADFKIGNIYIDTKNEYLAIVDLPKIDAARQQNNVDLRIFTIDMITEEQILPLKHCDDALVL